MNRSFVYLVGAGPGDPDLLTVRGLHLLSVCDVILYDRLAAPELLDHCRPDCEKIDAGKVAGHHYKQQNEINELMIRKAREGKTVLRLKGGDPFVFGRGGEECEALQEAGIPYEVVPGITSAIAVPAAAGIPVTHRKACHSFTVVTGHTADGPLEEELNFPALAASGSTLVFLMGFAAAETIARELQKAGMAPETPAAMITDGTMDSQHVLRSTLAALTDDMARDPDCRHPATLVVGEVAGLDLTSTAPLPLSGTRSAICGTAAFCHKLVGKLARRGVETLSLPYVRIQPLPEAAPKAVRLLEQTNVLVFTGRNAIELFLAELDRQGRDIRSLSGHKIAVIGPGTAAALRHHHLQPDWIPAEYSSEGLGRLLCRTCSEDDTLLIPRAEKGNSVLADMLTAAGIPFEEIALYDTVLDPAFPLEKLTAASEDPTIWHWVFASAEGVRLFFQAGGTIPPHAPVVCIGPYTAQALREAGVSNIIVSEESSADGLAETLEREENCS